MTVHNGGCRTNPDYPTRDWVCGRRWGMGVNVRGGDRDQLFLMPPLVTDWLPEDHLAWFVLDVVAELDLGAFYAEFRLDGRGGAVYDPSMMLGVLVYAYCTGERSSRRIERRLVDDVAYRVLAANQCPDHATLARFRRRHRGAIGGLFGQVLALCVKAGLVDTGLVAIDGTKLAANASFFANRDREQLAEEILAEAEAVDAAEDDEFGDRRGDELPVEWSGGRDRRARIKAASRNSTARPPATTTREWPSELRRRPRQVARRPARSRPRTRLDGRRRGVRTRPIRTRGSSPTPRGASCRATTPRQQPPPGRSWWRPRSPPRPTISRTSCRSRPR